MPPREQTSTRSWGTRFDSLTTSSPSASPDASSVSQTMANLALVSPTDLSTPSNPGTTIANGATNEDRVYKDANVFVGSLPVGVELTELKKRLTAHLSSYAPGVQVNKIFSSKDGGCQCAFVQCADASSADHLIGALTSRPVPFLGRQLRYERAREQRKLAISYKTPMGVNYVAEKSQAHSITKPRDVELPPATAMRVRRLPSRMVETLFDAHATAEYHGSESEPHPRDPLSGAGLLFDPLVYDGETMQRLVSAFGPVEHFEAKSDIPRDVDFNNPHNAPKSDCMAKGCWEVEWEHREDCVTAYHTLRSVKHLAVTWAHSRSPYPPRHGAPPHGFRSLYMHSQRPYSGSGGQGPWNDPTRRITVLEGYVPSHLRTSTYSTASIDADVNTAAGTAGSAPSSRHPSTPSSDRADGTIRVMDTAPEGNSQAESGSADGSRRGVSDATGPVFSNDDFPPLAELGPGKDESAPTSWGDEPLQEIDHGGGYLGRSSLSISEHDPPKSLGSVDDRGGLVSPEPDLVTPDSPELTFPRIDCSTAWQYSTPEVNVDHGGYIGHGFMSPDLRVPRANDGQQRPIDPTTIFIGGLEKYGPSAWTEDRIKIIFGQYGQIIDVKFVTPAVNKSAFAFVKYANGQAAARAIEAQHNRNYHGREIRVQLRTIDTHQHHALRFSARGRGRPLSQRTPIYRPDPRINGTGDGSTETNAFDLSGIRTPPVDSNHGQSLEFTPTDAFPSQPSPDVASPTYPLHLRHVPFPSAGYSVLPNGGFYPAPHWYPNPYVPAMHGGPPGYVGHPGAALVGHSVSEGTGAVAYQALSQYSPYPVTPTRSLPEQGKQPDIDGHPAPLVPIGFMQGEQGLIPVYHPEALDQRMSHNHPTQTNSLQSEAVQRSSSTPATPSTWPNPAYPGFYPVPGSSGATPVPFNPSFYPAGQGYMGPGYGWYPNPGPLPVPMPPPHAAHPLPALISSHGSNAEGGHGRGSGPGRYSLQRDRSHGPSAKRHTRRDHVHTSTPSSHQAIGAHGQRPASSFTPRVNRNGGAVSMQNIADHSASGSGTEFYRSSDSSVGRSPMRQSSSSPAYFETIGSRRAQNNSTAHWTNGRA